MIRIEYFQLSQKKKCPDSDRTEDFWLKFKTLYLVRYLRQQQVDTFNSDNFLGNSICFDTHIDQQNINSIRMKYLPISVKLKITKHIYVFTVNEVPAIFCRGIYVVNQLLFPMRLSELNSWSALSFWSLRLSVQVAHYVRSYQFKFHILGSISDMSIFWFSWKNSIRM